MSIFVLHLFHNKQCGCSTLPCTEPNFIGSISANSRIHLSSSRSTIFAAGANSFTPSMHCNFSSLFVPRKLVSIHCFAIHPALLLLYFCFICHIYPPFTRMRIVSLYFGREVRTRLGVAFFEVYGPPVFHIKVGRPVKCLAQEHNKRTCRLVLHNLP